VRADRLLSLVLLLQARGRVTAGDLAAELGVSVRTVYRDLDGLSAAGVPVYREPGPGGGCRLLAGYQFPLRGLSPEEAEALLILGVPAALRELGLDRAAEAAHRRIRITAGLDGTAGGPEPGDEVSPAGTPLVHLDLPPWFRSQEEVPQLRTLAEALKQRRQLELRYQSGAVPSAPVTGPPEAGGETAGDATTGDATTGDATTGDATTGDATTGDATASDPAVRPPARRTVAPLGLVNKAGAWYLVARTSGRRIRVFRASRIAWARIRPEAALRPAGFELAAFWRSWSDEFASSRPQLAVLLRASPRALGVFGEVFGPAAGDALRAAGPPDENGWREVTLTFQHEHAAAHRLAGFGAEVEVLAPEPVRALLVRAARGILDRYVEMSG
jgi:predicted DNA-binding transcriptional regulator YafY